MATIREWKRDFNKLPKWGKFSIVLAIIGLVGGGKYIINHNSIQIQNNIYNITNYGTLSINTSQPINNVSNCPECPTNEEYYPIELQHNILVSCPECEGFSNIEIDLNNVKFNLPNNYSIFLEKLIYNESTVVGFCTANSTYCDILPQYVFDKVDAVCMEINISKFGKWKIPDMGGYDKRKACITLHGTNIKLNGNVTDFGLINHFTFNITKNNVPTKIDINIYRIKFTLPNGQEVFFEKFLHNESIIFSLCNDDKSDCYIFPNYRYDKEKNNVCIDAILNNWNDVSFTIKKAINLASCIQDSNTNKFLSEECTAQYNSCSSN